MKKILFGLIMFFLLVITAYHLFFFIDNRTERELLAQNRNTTRLTTTELASIKEGDFILRRGFGYFSDIIAKKLNSGAYDVTHAGIIVKRQDKLYVIHSLSSNVSSSNGVQIQSLDSFLLYSAPNKIIITRAKNCSPKIGKKIALKAENYLTKKIPFDHNGNYDDDSAFFCTEIIWKILEKDLQLLKLPQDHQDRKNHFYSMTSMYQKDYFDIKVNQYK